MHNLIRQCKALGDPTRFKMVKMLERGELCVCEFAQELGLAQSTISRHLNLLRQAGLVEARKDGQWLYCRLPDADVDLDLDAETSALLDLVRDSGHAAL